MLSAYLTAELWHDVGLNPFFLPNSTENQKTFPDAVYLSLVIFPDEKKDTCLVSSDGKILSMAINFYDNGLPIVVKDTFFVTNPAEYWENRSRSRLKKVETEQDLYFLKKKSLSYQNKGHGPIK